MSGSAPFRTRTPMRHQSRPLSVLAAAAAAIPFAALSAQGLPPRLHVPAVSLVTASGTIVSYTLDGVPSAPYVVLVLLQPPPVV